MLVTVSDPTSNATSGTHRFLTFILWRDVALSTWPSAFLKYPYPSWHPTPCVHHYRVLYPLESFFLCCVASVILVVWPEIFIFRVLIYPWIWMIVFCMVAMAEYLVIRWLVYSSTWVVSFMLAPVRLVTAALSSAVACDIFAKASLIHTTLLDP